MIYFDGLPGPMAERCEKMEKAVMRMRTIKCDRADYPAVVISVMEDLFPGDMPWRDIVREGTWIPAEALSMLSANGGYAGFGLAMAVRGKRKGRDGLWAAIKAVLACLGDDVAPGLDDIALMGGRALYLIPRAASGNYSLVSAENINQAVSGAGGPVRAVVRSDREYPYDVSQSSLLLSIAGGAGIPAFERRLAEMGFPVSDAIGRGKLGDLAAAAGLADQGCAPHHLRLAESFANLGDDTVLSSLAALVPVEDGCPVFRFPEETDRTLGALGLAGYHVGKGGNTGFAARMVTGDREAMLSLVKDVPFDRCVTPTDLGKALDDLADSLDRSDDRFLHAEKPHDRILYRKDPTGTKDLFAGLCGTAAGDTPCQADLALPEKDGILDIPPGFVNSVPWSASSARAQRGLCHGRAVRALVYGREEAGPCLAMVDATGSRAEDADGIRSTLWNGTLLSPHDDIPVGARVTLVGPSWRLDD